MYEKHIDWELIAACHGFLLSPDNTCNNEVATYMQRQLTPNKQGIERPKKADSVALSILNVAEPDCPWDAYALFADAPNSDIAIELYSFDFN